MDLKTALFLSVSFVVSFIAIYLLTGLGQGVPLFSNQTQSNHQIALENKAISASTSSESDSSATNSETFKLPEEELSFEPIIIAFVGDMMFDRYIRQVAQDFGYGYILEGIDKYLNKLDLVIGNLEGPVTSLPSESIGTKEGEPGHFQFTFSPNILPVLENAGFQAVTIGNNHLMDFGSIGLDETRTFLDSFGIHFFGDPYKEDRQTAALLVDQVAVGLVSYNQFIEPDKNATIEHIKSFENDADLIAVVAHWGNEYEQHPDQNQIVLARSFIDAGADIVIGTHPHVIQSKEVYKGKHIYYSLGNFVFDQYFSDEVRCGAIIELHINPNHPDTYTVKETFSELVSSGQTVLSVCSSEVPEL